MITNAMHARQPEPNDEVDASVRRNRHVFGEPIRARNYNDHLRQRMWWLHFVENRWVTFTYIFFTCALIRMWVLVSATENRVYIAITAGATAAFAIFYLRWRRRREVVVREAFAQRQQEIDGSFVSIQDVLVTQAALRAAQSGDTVSPENMPLVIASLPSIIYQTPQEAPQMSPSPSLRIPTSRQSSISSSVLGTSLSGSARVVPVDTDSFSDSTPTPKTYDINGKEVQEPLCMICLSNFQDGDILSLLPCACGHQYHRVCLISWLERKVTCPLCTVSVGGLLLGNHQNSLSRLPQSDSVIQARQHVRNGNGDRDGDDNTQTNPMNRHVDLSIEVDRPGSGSGGILGDRNIDIDIEDGRGQRYMDTASATASASASALPIATPITIPPPSPAFVSAQSVPGRERSRGRILTYNGAPHSSI